MSPVQKKKLTKTAFIVMLSIVLSRITGFIREILIPNILGTNEVGDAYVIAFRITGLMYDLLVGGAIAAALIPVLSGYLARDEEEEGWKAVSTFINSVLILMVFTCVLGVIFAPQIVSFSNDVFDMKLKSLDLAVRLTRILFPSVAFLMLAGITNGILNSYNKFAAATYGPSIYNIGSALSILIFSRFGVEAVAVGVMASSILYFLFQLSFGLKNMRFYRPAFFWNHVGFKKMFSLSVPSLASSSIVQINIIITTFFVPFFGTGNVTAFQTADRIWQMPYGVFAQGMGIAMLPMLSANLAVGEIDQYKNTLLKGLKTVLLLTVPSAVALVVLNYPVISIFKLSKKFGDAAAVNAGNILMFFSIALITQSVVTVLNRAFYADNDAKTPLFIGVTTILLNILLSYLLRHTSLGVAGMALAYSAASTLNACLLILILNRKMKGIYIKKLMIFTLKVVPSALLMGAVLFAINSFVKFSDFSKVIQFILLAVYIIVGVAVYFGAALILKIDEAQNAVSTIRIRMKKIFKF
ncbi:MAG TPA: murein biosynthesis integral membrane protein MurJ [Pseudobacteroides sp.]|uniref:murein biosynthesis integral membrane protein MurJ n=1 Tax=Pseudobacteroides sp. TaxID=1968840 RepID=UPI002F93B1B4